MNKRQAVNDNFYTPFTNDNFTSKLNNRANNSYLAVTATRKIGGIFVSKFRHSLWRESGSSNVRGCPNTVVNSRHLGSLTAFQVANDNANLEAYMTALACNENNLISISKDLKVSSLTIAEKFDKRHKDVLRAIQALEMPQDFTERNFALSEYKDSTGRTLPAYELTRDGFSILIMGFTGKKAMKWKIAFLDAFTEMESALSKPRSRRVAKKAPALPPELISIVACNFTASSGAILADHFPAEVARMNTFIEEQFIQNMPVEHKEFLSTYRFIYPTNPRAWVKLHEYINLEKGKVA